MCFNAVIYKYSCLSNVAIIIIIIIIMLLLLCTSTPARCVDKQNILYKGLPTL